MENKLYPRSCFPRTAMKIYHGTIITCDREDHVHNYLVEDKGRILYAGAELPAAYRGAPVEALGGRALLPCFGDTHLHFASYALFNAGLDVRSEIGRAHV